MESLIIIVHVLAAIGITGLVLIQQGKGADMGASFGSGASQTIFGSVGSGNALTTATSWLTVVFFVTSLTLALFARQQVSGGIQEESLLLNPDQAPVLEQDVPAVPVSGQSATDLPQAPPAAEATEGAAAAVQEQAPDNLEAGADAASESAAEQQAEAAGGTDEPAATEQ